MSRHDVYVLFGDLSYYVRNRYWCVNNKNKKKIYSFLVNTTQFSSCVTITFKFSLLFRTRENTDGFITLYDNVYGIHNKRVNIFYICQ